MPIVGSSYSKQLTGRHRVGPPMFDDRRLARQQLQVIDLHRPTIEIPIKRGWHYSGGTVSA